MRKVRSLLIKLSILKAHIDHFLFQHLFPGEYDHMRHLVDDVIRLETLKPIESTNRTYYWTANFGGL